MKRFLLVLVVVGMVGFSGCKKEEKAEKNRTRVQMGSTGETSEGDLGVDPGLLFNYIEMDELDKLEEALKQDPRYLSSRNYFDETLLIFASRNNKKEALDLLLELGMSSSINAVCPRGYTALSHAFEEGHHEIAQALIAAGGTRADGTT